MSILYLAGFNNHGNDAADKERYDVVNAASFSTQTASGHEAGKYGGTGYIQSVSSTGTEFITLSASETAGRVVFWARAGNDSGVSNNGVLRINSGGTNAFFIHYPDGPLELRNSGGVVATGTTTIGGSSSSPSQWHHFDITFDLTAGTCQLLLDGVSEINASFSPDAASWDNIVFRGATAGFLAGGDYWVRDDVVVEDGTTPVTINSHRIFHVLPSSDVSSQWTPSTGFQNYAMVDDTNPDQLGTYVESTAVNDRDVYGHGSATVGSTIHAVQVKALCTGGGNIRLGLTDGVTENVSANIAVDATLWKEAYYVLELAPDGGAWSQAKLDAVDIIIEADSAGVQATQVQLEVLTNVTGPATPTLFLDTATETSVTMHTSDFVGSSSLTHAASQWQISNASDTSFSSPVYNPGDDATNLTEITVTGLDPAKPYIARARHKDGNSLYSGWSNTISFNTVGSSGLYYFPVALGDTVTLAAEFVKENPTDTTTATVRMPLYDVSKVAISGGGDPDRLAWTTSEDGSRKQTKFTITNIFINVTEGWKTPAWIGTQIDGTGDLGHTSGFNYCCAWLNAPDFGLQSNLTLSSNNVTLAWTSEIPCRVKYIANTTGYTTLQDVHENGTFTSASEVTSDSDVVFSGLGFGQRAYITFVAFDEDGKRNGVLQTRAMFNDEVVSTTQDPAGATPDVDWSLGPQHTLVLDQNCAPTFSNPVKGQTYTLIVQQDATGGWTFTWPSSVKVSGGTLPTVTSTANAEDVFELYVAGVGPDVYYLTIVCQDCA